MKDKCEAMLGPNWETINKKCFPKCSKNTIARSNIGWCMESKITDCPEGWELKTVIGNGNGAGGTEAHRIACVPTKSGKQTIWMDCNKKWSVCPRLFGR